MKKIYSSIVLFFIACSTFAQTPTFWNYNVAGAANAFPFGTTTSRKVQWRILANSLGGVTAGNNITVVYFMTGSAGSNLYPLINISLKQGVPMFAGGGNFETGMTLVYTGTNITKTGTIGGWISFVLQTPFTYDPNQPLFVEVEHNATAGAGPTVYQTSPVGPGSGRQYGNYPNPTYTGVDATVAHFGIDVVPNTPCTGAPFANTVVPQNYNTCFGLANPSLSLATPYLLGGLNYIWQSSTISPVGPFTTIPGYTLNTAPVPTLGITTWYQAVVTCTNPGGGTTTLTATSYSLGGPTSSVVPYYESFENIQVPNKLPNCSWLASSLANQNLTAVTAGSGNRLPRTGVGYASFNNASPGVSYYYTNPIQMEPGVTYSAGLWYATEYFGYNNWTNLSILIGTSQTPAGLVQIASVGPAISGPYKDLGNYFTVPTSGQYYIVIRATGSAGSAQYLSWDDLSVTIPCTPVSGNSPTLTVNPSATLICAGDVVNITANGATGYLWNTGATTNNISDSPISNTVYVVAGTNTMTGCTETMTQIVDVNPSPVMFIVSNKTEVCPGEPASLTAYGANIYVWTNNTNGNVTVVNPVVATTYIVNGTNQYACSSSASITINVKPAPNIGVVPANESCVGEPVLLTATGGSTYMWYSSSSSALYQGNPINVPLYTTTTFTVIGTGTNGCSKKQTVNQSVTPCTGINERSGSISGVMIYPNPTAGEFTIELGSGSVKAIEIFDMTGRVILKQTSSDDKIKVNVSNVAKGIYYVSIKSDGAVEVLKLIKE